MDLSVLLAGVVGFAFGALVGALVTRAVLGVERLSRNVAQLHNETKDPPDE